MDRNKIFSRNQYIIVHPYFLFHQILHYIVIIQVIIVKIIELVILYVILLFNTYFKDLIPELSLHTKSLTNQINNQAYQLVVNNIRIPVDSGTSGQRITYFS